MTKIIYCIDGLRSGGKERRLLALINQLLDYKDYKMELVVFNKDVHYKEALDWNIKIHFVEHHKLGKFAGFKQVYRIVNDVKPQIIHSWDTLSTLFSIPAAKLSGAKLITSMITDAPPSYKRLSVFGILSEICFYSADLILANSQAGIDAYGVSAKKSRVIHNGFDFRRTQRLTPKDEVRNKYGINYNYLVGMVASFSRNKDFETFLQAAHIVMENYPEIGFICTGDGLLRNELEKIYATHGIVFTGKQKDTESIMNLCDVGVLMSNNAQHGEGLSNSLLEFMALSKPVIASDNGGNRELVENGVTGTILSANDPTLLATCIINHFENPEQAHKMGLAAKKRVEHLFSIDTMVNNFTMVYAETI